MRNSNAPPARVILLADSEFRRWLADLIEPLARPSSIPLADWDRLRAGTMSDIPGPYLAEIERMAGLFSEVLR